VLCAHWGTATRTSRNRNGANRERRDGLLVCQACRTIRQPPSSARQDRQGAMCLFKQPIGGSETIYKSKDLALSAADHQLGVQARKANVGGHYVKRQLGISDRKGQKARKRTCKSLGNLSYSTENELPRTYSYTCRRLRCTQVARLQ